MPPRRALLRPPKQKRYQVSAEAVRLTNSPAPCRRRALIYMALERPEGTFAGHEEESRQVIQSLAEIDVEATDITGNDLAKTHARYLAGGTPLKNPALADEH